MSRQKRPRSLSEDGHIRHREPSFVGIDLGEVAQQREIGTNVNEYSSQFENWYQLHALPTRLNHPRMSIRIDVP